MHPPINWQSAFQLLPFITGLPLRFERGKWYGACYINGEPHSRHDKTVAYLRKDGIGLLEQGGESMSLVSWLVRYGGCAGYREAFEHIRTGASGYISPPTSVRTWVEPPLRYVSDSEVEVRDGDCALRKFLTSRFGAERVTKVWDKYRVGSKVLRDGSVATVFWYLDSMGKCCHDKVMLYGSGGRRNREYGGGRKYKVGDGFRGRTYFGSHLLREHKGRVGVLESEKSALIMSVAHPDTLWLATGGASMLREVGKDWKLWGDFDTAGLCWVDRFPSQCVKWWEKYEGVEKGMDIADIILRSN